MEKSLLSELIKRLESKELSEQEEKELSVDIHKASELIVRNKKDRDIQKLKLEKIKQDKDKLEKLNILNSNIDKFEIKLNRNHKFINMFGIAIMLFTVLGSFALLFLGFALSMPVVFNALMPFLSLPIAFGISYPIVSNNSKKMTINGEELAMLKKEKQLLFDEITLQEEIIDVVDTKHVKTNLATTEYVDENEYTL